MANFIETTDKEGKRQLINLDLVYKVNPTINGNGCVVYFEGTYEHIGESYESVVSKLVGKNKDKS